MSEFYNRIIHGDCREVMSEMPEKSVDCVVFSPPYYGLRSYGDSAVSVWGGDKECDHEWVDGDLPITRIRGRLEIVNGGLVSKTCVKCGAWMGQLGFEPYVEGYIANMTEVCSHIYRVLKDSGSMWIIIGDSYAYKSRGVYNKKCLLGVPWRLAFSLIDDGWILRSSVIWVKPNAMPESVSDRFSNKYEYVFHFVKSRKYYFNLDAVKEPSLADSVKRYFYGSSENIKSYNFRNKPIINVYKNIREIVEDLKNREIKENKYFKGGLESRSPSVKTIRKYLSGEINDDDLVEIYKLMNYLSRKLKESGLNLTKLAKMIGVNYSVIKNIFTDKLFSFRCPTREIWDDMKGILGLGEYDEFVSERLTKITTLAGYRYKNPGDVWHISLKPFHDAHFATYPPDLVVKPILATCPPDGVVLDPFCGSGTTCYTVKLINTKKWDILHYEPNEYAKNIEWNIKFIGIEVNEKYVEMARKRVNSIPEKLDKYIGGDD